MKKHIRIFAVALLMIPGWIHSQAFLKSIDPQQYKGNYKELAKQISMFYDTATGSNRGGYKQWKRSEWFAMHHLDERGDLSDYVARNAEAIEEVKQLNNPGSRMAPNGNWFNIGYGSLWGTEAKQGRVNSIAFDPVNSNILYAATAGGGIWKTFNNGEDWINLTIDFPALGIADVVVSPAPNNHILYALTGDLTDQPNVYPHLSLGIFKSYDSGQTWTKTSLSFQMSAGVVGYKLLMDPVNQNLLYAGTTNGLYRTTNGGDTWTLTAINSVAVNDMEFQPGNSDTLYLALRSNNSLYKYCSSTNIWKSRLVAPATVDRMEIGVTPDNPGAVFVLAGPGFLLPGDPTNYFIGLFRSLNSGETFTMMSNTCNANGDLFRSSGNQSFYDNTIWVDPFEENHLVAGGVNLFSSNNAGTTLNQITATTIHADHHNIQRNPLNGELWLCTDGGIYRSTDNGNTWNSRSQGLVINEFYRISTTQNANDWIIGGTQDNGQILRNSLGYQHVMNGDGMDNYFNSFNNDIVYACSQNGGLRRSVNGGQNWLVVGLPNADSASYFPWITPILQHPPSYIPAGGIWLHQDVIYVYAYQGIWRSTDGFHFTLMPNLIPGQASGFAASMAIGNDSGGSILYVSNGVSIWLFVNPLDDNTIWGSCDVPNLNGGFITSMAVNPADREEIWITVSGYSSGTKVFRSMNSGYSFSNVSLSLPNVPVYSITFANQTNNPPGAVYAGTEIGVFYKDDLVPNWVPFSNGLPHVPVTDLAMNYTMNTLKAGTYGRGIWETETYDACAPAIVVNYDIIHGQHNYEASEVIVGFNLITGGVGTRVTMKAGDRVVLFPNFRVSNGAYFRAATGVCGSGPLDITSPGSNQSVGAIELPGEMPETKRN